MRFALAILLVFVGHALAQSPQNLPRQWRGPPYPASNSITHVSVAITPDTFQSWGVPLEDIFGATAQGIPFLTYGVTNEFLGAGKVLTAGSNITLSTNGTQLVITGSGGGGGSVGPGTSGKIPLFDSTTTIGDSIASQTNGTNIVISGRLGIGTLTPTNAAFQINSEGSGMAVVSTNGPNGAVIDTFLNKTTPLAGDRISEFHAYATDSTGEKTQYTAIYSDIRDPSNFIESGSMYMNVTGNGNLLAFFHANGDAARLDWNEGVAGTIDFDHRWKIPGNDNGMFFQGSDGFLGLGTVPTYKLHVLGATTTTQADAIARIYASATKGLWFGYNVANSVGMIGATTDGSSHDNISVSPFGGNVGIGLVAVTVVPGSRLSIGGNLGVGLSYRTLAAPANGMIVEGNVGIGTSSPAAALSVVGSVAISGGYTNVETASRALFNDANSRIVATGTSAMLSGALSDETGTGVAVFSTDPVFSTSIQIPNGAAPTVDAVGEIAVDNNLWAASRGSLIYYDGTAAVAAVGALVSDTPSNGQVPKWNTGGTITWEDDNSAAPASGDAAYVNETAVSDSFSLTNSAASSTLASITWSISSGTDPDPDRVSVAIGPASATDAGIVTAGTQTIAGDKTFSGAVEVGGALTKSGTAVSVVGHAHAGEDITSGTVADARIDAAIARDAEVAAAYQPLDADLTDLADGSLSGSKVGTGIDAANLTTGTLSTNRYTRVGVFRTIWIDAGAMVSRTTSGAAAATEEYATNDRMSDHYLFDGTTSEAVQFRLSMPDEWDLSTVKVKVYWDAAAAGSGAVVWGVKAAALSNDDAIDGAWGSEVNVTDTVIAVGDLHVSPATAAVTVGGTPALQDLIWFEIDRNPADGSDTMSQDAKLLGVMIQYHELTTEPSAW